MADIIEQAKAAQHGVIQGPWELRDGFIYPLAIRFGLGSIRPQDARFIAWARTGVPELVAELRAARAENERLEGIIDAHHDGMFLMTDLRQRLADALQPHAYENGRCHCGQRWTGNFDDHLADVLLSTDGIMIMHTDTFINLFKMTTEQRLRLFLDMQTNKAEGK